MTDSYNKTYRLVGFWTRFWAYLIDIITIASLTNLILGKYAKSLTWLSVSLISVGIIGFVYFAVMTKIFSQTLGKMILGIKVIRDDNEPLDWLTVIYREGIGRFISQLMGFHLGYLWVGFNSEKQAWHDTISDTYVVFIDELTEKQMITIASSK